MTTCLDLTILRNFSCGKCTFVLLLCPLEHEMPRQCVQKLLLILILMKESNPNPLLGWVRVTVFASLRRN